MGLAAERAQRACHPFRARSRRSSGLSAAAATNPPLRLPSSQRNLPHTGHTRLLADPALGRIFRTASGAARRFPAVCAL